MLSRRKKTKRNRLELSNVEIKSTNQSFTAHDHSKFMTFDGMMSAFESKEPLSTYAVIDDREALADEFVMQEFIEKNQFQIQCILTDATLPEGKAQLLINEMIGNVMKQEAEMRAKDPTRISNLCEEAEAKMEEEMRRQYLEAASLYNVPQHNIPQYLSLSSKPVCNGDISHQNQTRAPVQETKHACEVDFNRPTFTPHLLNKKSPLPGIIGNSKIKSNKDPVEIDISISGLLKTGNQIDSEKSLSNSDFALTNSCESHFNDKSNEVLLDMKQDSTTESLIKLTGHRCEKIFSPCNLAENAKADHKMIDSDQTELDIEAEIFVNDNNFTTTDTNDFFNETITYAKQYRNNENSEEIELSCHRKECDTDWNAKCIEDNTMPSNERIATSHIDNNMMRDELQQSANLSISKDEHALQTEGKQSSVSSLAKKIFKSNKVSPLSFIDLEKEDMGNEKHSNNLQETTGNLANSSAEKEGELNSICSWDLSLQTGKQDLSNKVAISSNVLKNSENPHKTIKKNDIKTESLFSINNRSQVNCNSNSHDIVSNWDSDDTSRDVEDLIKDEHYVNTDIKTHLQDLEGNSYEVNNRLEHCSRNDVNNHINLNKEERHLTDNDFNFSAELICDNHDETNGLETDMCTNTYQHVNLLHKSGKVLISRKRYDINCTDTEIQNRETKIEKNKMDVSSDMRESAMSVKNVDSFNESECDQLKIGSSNKKNMSYVIENDTQRLGTNCKQHHKKCYNEFLCSQIQSNCESSQKYKKCKRGDLEVTHAERRSLLERVKPCASEELLITEAEYISSITKEISSNKDTFECNEEQSKWKIDREPLMKNNVTNLKDLITSFYANENYSTDIPKDDMFKDISPMKEKNKEFSTKPIHPRNFKENRHWLSSYKLYGMSECQGNIYRNKNSEETSAHDVCENNTTEQSFKGSLIKSCSSIHGDEQKNNTALNLPSNSMSLAENQQTSYTDKKLKNDLFIENVDSDFNSNESSKPCLATGNESECSVLNTTFSGKKLTRNFKFGILKEQSRCLRQNQEGIPLPTTTRSDSLLQIRRHLSKESNFNYQNVKSVMNRSLSLPNTHVVLENGKDLMTNSLNHTIRHGILNSNREASCNELNLRQTHKGLPKKTRDNFQKSSVPNSNFSLNERDGCESTSVCNRVTMVEKQQTRPASNSSVERKGPFKQFINRHKLKKRNLYSNFKDSVQTKGMSKYQKSEASNKNKLSVHKRSRFEKICIKLKDGCFDEKPRKCSWSLQSLRNDRDNNINSEKTQHDKYSRIRKCEKRQRKLNRRLLKFIRRVMCRDNLFKRNDSYENECSEKMTEPFKSKKDIYNSDSDGEGTDNLNTESNVNHISPSIHQRCNRTKSLIPVFMKRSYSNINTSNKYCYKNNSFTSKQNSQECIEAPNNCHLITHSVQGSSEIRTANKQILKNIAVEKGKSGHMYGHICSEESDSDSGKVTRDAEDFTKGMITLQSKTKEGEKESQFGTSVKQGDTCNFEKGKKIHQNDSTCKFMPKEPSNENNINDKKDEDIPQGIIILSDRTRRGFKARQFRTSAMQNGQFDFRNEKECHECVQNPEEISSQNQTPMKLKMKVFDTELAEAIRINDKKYDLSQGIMTLPDMTRKGSKSRQFRSSAMQNGQFDFKNEKECHDCVQNPVAISSQSQSPIQPKVKDFDNELYEAIKINDDLSQGIMTLSDRTRKGSKSRQFRTSAMQNGQFDFKNEKERHDCAPNPVEISSQNQIPMQSKVKVFDTELVEAIRINDCKDDLSQGIMTLPDRTRKGSKSRQFRTSAMQNGQFDLKNKTERHDCFQNPEEISSQNLIGQPKDEGLENELYKVTKIHNDKEMKDEKEADNASKGIKILPDIKREGATPKPFRPSTVQHEQKFVHQNRDFRSYGNTMKASVLKYDNKYIDNSKSPETQEDNIPCKESKPLRRNDEAYFNFSCSSENHYNDFSSESSMPDEHLKGIKTLANRTRQGTKSKQFRTSSMQKGQKFYKRDFSLPLCSKVQESSKKIKDFPEDKKSLFDFLSLSTETLIQTNERQLFNAKPKFVKFDDQMTLNNHHNHQNCNVQQTLNEKENVIDHNYLITSDSSLLPCNNYDRKLSLSDFPMSFIEKYCDYTPCSYIVHHKPIPQRATDMFNCLWTKRALAELVEHRNNFEKVRYYNNIKRYNS